MRILIANRISTAVGGAEEFLRRIVPQLEARGHEVSFLFEHDGGADSIAPVTAQVWFQDRAGTDATLQSVAAWKPDLIYCNGLDGPAAELALSRIAPSIYAAHAYFGTCISGRKMHAFPSKVVCQKRFGAACLAHYLPRRCGGLSPISMLTRYREETRRLAAIRQYSAVVVHSDHMRREYERHGITASVVPLPTAATTTKAAARLDDACERRLVFVGRLMDLKGCEIVLNATAQASRSLPAVKLTIAGDGEDRAGLERHARAIAPSAPNLTVRFAGHVNTPQRDAIFGDAHGVLIGSVWPEPFGMVGLEAAAFGVPAVAFDVGGISDWLKKGVSGCLAQPPSAGSFAKAILECVGDPQRHARLSDGARAIHAEFARRSTTDALEAVFARVVGCNPS